MLLLICDAITCIGCMVLFVLTANLVCQERLKEALTADQRDQTDEDTVRILDLLSCSCTHCVFGYVVLAQSPGTR